MLAIFVLAAPLRAQRADTLLIRTHTRILAADSLGGRETGSRGERIAAAYIAAELARLGLEPLGDSGYAAPFPVERVTIDDDSTLLWLSGSDSVFAHGRDFLFVSGGAEAFRGFAGVLRFQGAVRRPWWSRPGIYDGRVLVLTEWPGAEADSALQAFARLGVTGIVVLAQDSAGYAGAAAALGDARYTVTDAAPDGVWSPPLPIVIAGPDLTRTLIRATTARRGTVEVRVRASGARQALAAANIVALLPGTDPARTDIAALSAHYDHLGIVRSAGGADSIYNGFSDNAAGVAMLLALADALARDRPAHPTLFLFFTGEERGLLGSSWFAAHPPLPLEHIRVVVNLDAGAPPAPPVSWRIATNDTALSVMAASALEARGWAVERSPARANSDHWPLAQAGVPALFLIPGRDWEALEPEAEAALRARWDRYHQPDDEWAADFPFAGLQRYAEAALATVQRVMRR